MKSYSAVVYLGEYLEPHNNKYFSYSYVDILMHVIA